MKKAVEVVLDNLNGTKCELAGEVLRSFGSLRLCVTGWSMLPTIWPGDTLVIEPVHADLASEGDIVLFSSGNRFVAHRVVAKSCAPPGGTTVQTQGDALAHTDCPLPGSALLGRVSFIMRNGQCVSPSKTMRFSERTAANLFRRSEIVARVVAGVHGLRRTSQNQT